MIAPMVTMPKPICQGRKCCKITDGLVFGLSVELVNGFADGLLARLVAGIAKLPLLRSICRSIGVGRFDEGWLDGLAALRWVEA